MAKISKLEPKKAAGALRTPTDLEPDGVAAIAKALNGLVCDAFALYVKTKNFHWHMSGPHFRDYHLLLDDQGDEIFATIDPLAERVRKIGATTVRSIGQVKREATIKDNDDASVGPRDMLAELLADNQAMVTAMRDAHAIADDHDDVGTASLLENYIDETEKRVWFLFEASRGADGSGH